MSSQPAVQRQQGETVSLEFDATQPYAGDDGKAVSDDRLFTDVPMAPGPDAEGMDAGREELVIVSAPTTVVATGQAHVTRTSAGDILRTRHDRHAEVNREHSSIVGR